MRGVVWLRRLFGGSPPQLVWPEPEPGDVPFFIINGYAYRVEPGRLVRVDTPERPTGIRYRIAPGDREIDR